MTRISELKTFPRELSLDRIREDLNNNPPSGWHESLMRSFQTLRYVRELLELNTPQSVIIEIIDEVNR